MTTASLLLGLALACLLMALATADCGSSTYGSKEGVLVPTADTSTNEEVYIVDIQSAATCNSVNLGLPIGVTVTICPTYPAPTPQVTVSSLTEASVVAYSPTVIHVVVHCDGGYSQAGHPAWPYRKRF